MKDLHPQAHTLLAYFDNQLDDSERAEVEALLAKDNSAVEFLASMKASDLPFKEIFDTLLDDDSSSENTFISESKTSKTSRWLWPTSLVASLLLGVAITFFSLNKTTENHDNWIVQVADYHLLYIRDTVNHSHASPAEIKQLTHKLGTQLNTNLVIPDLTPQNLDFRRGQILDSNGRKLVQLAYLPKKGRPVALCILKDNVEDSLPKSGESRGLPYVTWSKDGFSYVIIGAINTLDLNNAALNALSQMSNKAPQS